ncbi:MAG: hypothetical protein JWQ07_5860 [Ramlibacter sp.]|nr:hypothetical protein [Ramlibacter sp.]
MRRLAEQRFVKSSSTDEAGEDDLHRAEPVDAAAADYR